MESAAAAETLGATQYYGSPEWTANPTRLQTRLQKPYGGQEPCGGQEPRTASIAALAHRRLAARSVVPTEYQKRIYLQIPQIPEVANER